MFIYMNLYFEKFQLTVFDRYKTRENNLLNLPHLLFKYTHIELHIV